MILTLWTISAHRHGVFGPGEAVEGRERARGSPSYASDLKNAAEPILQSIVLDARHVRPSTSLITAMTRSSALVARRVQLCPDEV